MLPLIILLVFGAVASLVVGVTRRSTSVIETRMQDLRTRAAVADEPEMDLSIPFAERVLKPSAETLARTAGSVLPASVLSKIERELVTAGNPMTMTGFLTMWAVCVLLMTGFVVLAAVVTIGANLGAKQVMVMLVFIIIGLMLPRIWLQGKVKARQKEVVRALPDALDLVTTCVEAGLGLDAALARVAEKSTGSLADEIGRMLKDVAMGKLRREALLELSERLSVEELTSFVNSVTQAEQLGVGVAQVLRVQSDQLRMRRRQQAEKSAHEASIKLLFPLVLLIFPAFMLVILGPAGIRIVESLGK